jgi:hypothetical protein
MRMAVNRAHSSFLGQCSTVKGMVAALMGPLRHTGCYNKDKPHDKLLQ